MNETTSLSTATDPAARETADTNAPSRMRERGGLWVFLAAAVTVTLWASAFIGIRAAGSSYHPGSLALLRMVVGSLALTVIALQRGVRWPPRRTIPLLAVWGIAWFAGYNLALNTAERKLDAGTAAMVVNLAPLIVVLLGGLLLGEGFPRRLIIGAPLSFLGVLIIGLSSSRGAHPEVTGVLLALVAALIYAGCTLVQKRLLKWVQATTLTWLGAVAGTVALLPWSGQVVHDARTAPLSATLAVVYMGIFPTAIAFTTWAYVLGRVSAGTTSATTYVVPAIAIVMSWLLLDEAPTWIKLVGGALCLLGVLVTNWRGKAKR